MNVAACQNSLPVACQRASGIRQPIVPSTGPARPTRASAPASLGSCFIATNAPRNGMNIGALAVTPSRRSWITWPISWMNSSATKTAPNFQPQISA